MNSKTSLSVFRCIAGFMSLYHIVLGLIGTFGAADFVISLANKVYGVAIQVDPDLFMSFARFASSYMIAFGCMMALVALKPLVYRQFAWAGVILIVIRIFDRIVFSEVLYRSLGVTLASSVPTLVAIGLLALGLIIFMPKQRS